MSEPSQEAKNFARKWQPFHIEPLAAAFDEATAELRERNARLDSDCAAITVAASNASQTAHELRQRCDKAESELKEWESERAWLVEKLCRRGEHSLIDSVEWRLDEHEKTQGACAAMREALQGCNEMFDTYGHTSESPCERDREIVAKMLAALATDAGRGWIPAEDVRPLVAFIRNEHGITERLAALLAKHGHLFRTP